MFPVQKHTRNYKVCYHVQLVISDSRTLQLLWKQAGIGENDGKVPLNYGVTTGFNILE